MTRHLRHIIVVGGGLAGARSAEALRTLGFDGAITMLCGEPTAPYDRPALSKGVLTGARDVATLAFGDETHYKDLGIDLRLGMRATGLDLHRKRVRTGDGDVPFDGIILTTGSVARQLPPQVVSPKARVHALRSREDAVQLRDALRESSRVIVIGAGFIGSEVASSAVDLGLAVTLLESAPIPLARVVGNQIGKVCAAHHRRNGVRLLTGVHVTAVDEHGGESVVKLRDGRLIHGDLVVAGIGSAPAVDWIHGSELTVFDGVLCDAYLSAGHPDVYAAGDIVRWPNGLFGTTMRSQQWTDAAQQARCAAHNLLAGDENRVPYRSPNYFWSDQHGTRMQAAGITATDEVRIVHGQADAFDFTALYRRGDDLVGAFSMNQAGAFVRSKQLIERREPWTAAIAFAEQGGLVA